MTCVVLLLLLRHSFHHTQVFIGWTSWQRSTNVSLFILQQLRYYMWHVNYQETVSVTRWWIFCRLYSDITPISAVVSTILSLCKAELNTSELVELLQKSAVEHLTTYRQLVARDFGSVATNVTTDFEALYAYKHGDYRQCLHCCLHRTYTRCCMLLRGPMFRHCRSLFSCWMMTLSDLRHWCWLSIVSACTRLTVPASVRSLCRCIWWLSVSWSYVTQWRHWLIHSTSLKLLREDIYVNAHWISWRSSWLNAKLRH